jgi:hypothetical protein
MGMLDDLVKALEEAQERAEGRRPTPRPVLRQPQQTPERDEDGAAWEDDPDAPAMRPSETAVVTRQVVMSRAASQPEAAHRHPAATAAALPPHALGPAPAVRLRAMLASRAAVRDLLIAREILGPPPGLRRLRRR